LNFLKAEGGKEKPKELIFTACIIKVGIKPQFAGSAVELTRQEMQSEVKKKNKAASNAAMTNVLDLLGASGLSCRQLADVQSSGEAVAEVVKRKAPSASLAGHLLK
jgi:hypothetical protein